MTKKQTTKEKKYWVEYRKLLSMMKGEVFLQYLNMRKAEEEFMKEYSK